MISLIPYHVQNLIDKFLEEQNITENHTLKVRTPLKPGDNWLGVILEIEIVSQKNVTLFKFISKLAPTTKLYRNFFPIRSCYEREIFTYEKVLPELIKLQEESQIKDIFAPFAKCYKTHLDDSEETVILNNMRKCGYEPINNQRPVEFQHASIIMETLGKLHALSFALQNKKPELFEEISANSEESFFNSHLRNSFLKMVQNLGKQVLNYMKKDSVAYKSFEKFVEDPSFVVDILLKSKSSGKYEVMCHGDPQTRNVLFMYENELEPMIPTKLCLLDWQLCKLGSPCLDIAFFVWTCTDKALRDSHYEELLNIYYDNLLSTLKSLGECPEKLYPKRVFKEDLKKFSVYGLFVSLWVVSSNLTKPEDFPDFSSADSADSLIDMLSTILNNEYFVRMNDVVEDFVNYGYRM